MSTQKRARHRRNAAREEGAELYMERRREVIEAASRVFAKKGYQATTIAAVAEELNIDRASLYYYISSKEELFDDVVREACEDNVRIAREIDESSDSALDKLKKFIIETTNSYERHYPLLHIYVRENLKTVGDSRSAWAKQMRQLNHDYEDAIIKIIEEGYEDGSFKNLGPSRTVAYAIMGMVNWVGRWYKPGNVSGTSLAIGSIFTELVINGLAAAPLQPVDNVGSAKAKAMVGD
ncbi:TetR/AcrR family transcriptional regulator [Tsuneonella sp. CC-YZS046]|uniref:TetR/AcrR family transcriptional regulator n=1 Tax=Tsuneonella sp. CC-YZS046 TaxID=3042152 RepID=UPI002D770BE8|nr:TetR/AcrR family transcriptional regulator [Tsuneonella sp. CC-YZS046]WRO67056.1 TetR/AcrR family transcriptional regulator [Tsuneonella sp. CC-YZS046]